MSAIGSACSPQASGETGLSEMKLCSGPGEDNLGDSPVSRQAAQPGRRSDLLGLRVSKFGAGTAETPVPCGHSPRPPGVGRDERWRWSPLEQQETGGTGEGQGGEFDPGSAPSLWGRGSGWDGTTASPRGAVRGESSSQSSVIMTE